MLSDADAVQQEDMQDNGSPTIAQIPGRPPAPARRGSRSSVSGIAPISVPISTSNASRQMLGIVAEAVAREKQHPTPDMLCDKADIKHLVENSIDFTVQNTGIDDVLQGSLLQPLVARLHELTQATQGGSGDVGAQVAGFLMQPEHRVQVAQFVLEVLNRTQVQQQYIRQDLKPLLAIATKAARRVAESSQ